MMQQQVQNNTQAKQPIKMFQVPKDVLCPEHNQIIQWLDLNQQCDRRLLCSQCYRPQNDKILSYNYVFSRVLQLKFQPIQFWRCRWAFVQLKQILFEQIDSIQHELQLLTNIYQLEFDPYSYSHLYGKESNFFKFDDLSRLAKEFSEKLNFKNDLSFFFTQLTEADQNKLNNIETCISLLQKCSEQIAKIQNYNYPPYECELLRVPKFELEKVNITKYDKQIEIPMDYEVTAIDIDRTQIAIACLNNDQPEIQIWNINKGQRLITLIQHKFRIIKLNYDMFLISVDSQCNIIFWNNTRTTWQVGRIFQAQMQFINCFQLSYAFRYLAIGGNSLQIWLLSNKDQYNVIDVTSPAKDTYISCLGFNSDSSMLVSGNQNGSIQIYQALEGNWENWKKIEEFLVFPQSIRNIHFRYDSNDFVCFQFGNKLIKFTKSDTGYEYKTQEIAEMDNAIIYNDFLLNPITYGGDNELENEYQIEYEMIVFYTIHLAVCKNNKIIIYITQVQV